MAAEEVLDRRARSSCALLSSDLGEGPLRRWCLGDSFVFGCWCLNSTNRNRAPSVFPDPAGSWGSRQCRLCLRLAPVCSLRSGMNLQPHRVELCDRFHETSSHRTAVPDSNLPEGFPVDPPLKECPRAHSPLYLRRRSATSWLAILMLTVGEL